MREIEVKEVTKAVSQLCRDANYYLGDDVLDALKRLRNIEESPIGQEVIDRIIENADIAAGEQIPLCQDCGFAVVFLELGQEVHIVGGDLYTAIAEGVRQGYTEGYLRKSIVNQPFSTRVNTGDNTPPVIYTDLVAGDRLKITVMTKGGGSENMSRFTVLTPAQGRAGIVEFAVAAVEEAGSNPCPPVIVGIGIGGTAEKAMIFSKKALLRRVGEPSEDPEVAQLEYEIFEKINGLGIGPQGFGGTVTALAVHIETFPAHIASLPVAVTVQCHSARHKEILL